MRSTRLFTYAMSLQTKKRVMAAGFGALAGVAAALAVALAFGLGTVPIALGQNATDPRVTTAQLSFEGITTISAGTSGSPGQNAGALEFGPRLDVNTTKPQISGTVKPARVPANQVPTPASNAIVTPNSVAGFNGITHRDQRLADNGNQFSLEPPDQGLAAGNGFVVEAVNNAIAVYDQSGNLLAGPMALNRFFGLPSEIVRSNPPVFGPFVSDPRVYFDKDTNTFFTSELAIDTNPASGAFLTGAAARSRTLIAVTHDPTSAWTVLSNNTTNDGDSQFGACPCFGDQPLIGADANGFYISTNAFSITTQNFRGAQLYAIPKAALAAGSITTVVRFSQLTEADVPFAFSIQPASTPPGGTFADANNGTEYFVSALDFNNELDNRLVVWALSNTASLNTSTPALHLTNAVVNTEVYGAPPSAQQKPGATPLADSVRNHEELVASNDDRLQQVVFAGGKLWTALNSVVKPDNGPVRVGVSWFILTPASTSGSVSATVANQGYVVANQNYVLFPAIGVNAAGKGAISFTLVGPDFFPSAAFATLDAANGAGDIQIAAPGALPDDGFTGYSAFGGARVGRWGDYSAAVADENGNIWVATEYIPNSPRTVNANWGTFVTRVAP
jgi:hypothetical protein